MPRLAPVEPVPSSPAPGDLPPDVLAYCAGLFDAVGTIRVARTATGLHLGVCVRHRVRAVREALLRLFGGRLRDDGSWYGAGTVALVFIAALRPHVRTYGPAFDLYVRAATEPDRASRDALLGELRGVIAVRSAAPLARPARRAP